jgi:CheY-like chemotaxis protein
MDDDRRTVFESGADDFLTKPCREDELLESMRALLEITYDYEDGPSEDSMVGGLALSVQGLSQLSAPLLEELRDATLNGNKRLLDRLIRKVRESENAGPANALQELADKYDYDALMRLLEEACTR